VDALSEGIQRSGGEDAAWSSLIGDAECLNQVNLFLAELVAFEEFTVDHDCLQWCGPLTPPLARTRIRGPLGNGAVASRLYFLKYIERVAV
jgi:hypothetical protein